MSDTSKIQWTDATWNPVRGCTPISPGCDHCYAKTFSERFRGVPGHPYEQGFDLLLVPGKLEEPLSWRKPRRVFVNSMSDLFHAGVPFEYVDRVVGTMQLAPRHTFQTLTKRASRMAAYLNSRDAEQPHMWWGVSVEDRKHGVPRIEHLRAASAAVRFVSFEPLIAPVGPVDLTGIHWAIIGGESGKNARPCYVTWIYDLIAQCRAQNVAVFVKQLGANVRVRFVDHGGNDGGSLRWTLNDPKGGDPEEWPADLRIREFPNQEANP